MTTPAPAPAQMPLGQVPVGHLFTPDSGATILKLTGKSLDGSLSGHAAGNPSAPFTIPAGAPELVTTVVHAMPDPEATPAPAPAPATLTPPPIVPGMVNTNIGQIAPAPTPVAPAAAVQAAFPGAQQISPPASQPGANALSRVIAGKMQFFGPAFVPAGAAQTGQMFAGFAEALTQSLPSGPEALACIEALLIARDAAVRALLAQ